MSNLVLKELVVKVFIKTMLKFGQSWIPVNTSLHVNTQAANSHVHNSYHLTQSPGNKNGPNLYVNEIESPSFMGIGFSAVKFTSII